MTFLYYSTKKNSVTQPEQIIHLIKTTRAEYQCPKLLFERIYFSTLSPEETVARHVKIAYSGAERTNSSHQHTTKLPRILHSKGRLVSGLKSEDNTTKRAGNKTTKMYPLLILTRRKSVLKRLRNVLTSG